MSGTAPAQDRPELIRFLAREELAQRQASATPRAEVTMTLVEGRPPVIRIYDVIDSWGGWWGISSQEIAAALDAVPDGTEVVEVHLNSPGGEAREGVAIANLLRQHPARVVAVVDGLAASAASMVAMGADELVMAPSSQLMIHEASGGAWGDAAFLEQQARALDHLSDSYAAAYARKAGGQVADWRDLMRAETWYSPEEAVAAGLADRLLDDADATRDPDAAVARHDLRRFAHAGRDDAPAPRLLRPAARATQTPAAPSASGSTPTLQEARMSLSDALRERLGIADENASEDTILAALDEALHEQADPAPIPPPAGVVQVDEATLAALQAQATAGAEARAEQLRRDREAAVAAAVADGRIAPARREHWLAQLEADPGAQAVLDSLAKGTIPVAPVGVANGAAVIDDEDAVFAQLFGSEKKGA